MTPGIATADAITAGASVEAWITSARERGVKPATSPALGRACQADGRR